MRFSTLTARFMIATALCLCWTTSARAVPPPTCGELGMWTWTFASGTGDGGPAACEAAWNDFAEVAAASDDYSISFGTTSTPWGGCVRTYACKACRLYEAEPLVFAPAPVSPGDAGDIAVGVANGVVYSIERTDGDGGGIVYAVNIRGAEGLVQILVDGRTGQASRVDPTASCQSSR